MPTVIGKFDFGAMFDFRYFQTGIFGARLLLEKAFYGVIVFRWGATLERSWRYLRPNRAETLVIRSREGTILADG